LLDGRNNQQTNDTPDKEASMDFFFNPRGIALIGASSNPAKGGYSILMNLKMGPRVGIYPVNPNYDEIEGLACYASVADVPDPVDLAIIFVPAGLVPDIVRQCADRGIAGVMIQSAGFGEAGEIGRRLQEQLHRACEDTGVRLWGPNCMGLVDAIHGKIFSFVSPVIRDEGLIAGKVSLIVQSGMLSAGFLIDIMTHATMGISKACSIGNKVDVDECDILQYLIDDTETGVIGLYLESIADGPRFLDLCRHSSKPLVVLKGGRSEKGAQAAMSHTASLAGDGAVIRHVLKQAGVVEAKGFKQMMDLCRSLAIYPAISQEIRKRVAVLTFSGAAGIISADFMEPYGLQPAELSPSARETLHTVFPEWMPINNPVDLWPAVERNGPEKTWEAAFRAACNDPAVDAIFFHVFCGGFLGDPDLSLFAEAARAAGKPIFGWLLGARTAVQDMQARALELGIPLFQEIERAVECMAAVLLRQDRPRLIEKQPQRQQSVAIGHEEEEFLRLHSGVLDEYLSKRILSEAGIPCVDERIVSSADEVREAARIFGFPMVLKGISQGRIHKSDVGMVRLGIVSVETAVSAYHDLTQRLPGDGRVLAQRQVRGRVELIAGVIHDAQFGACVMLGAGGILVELLADRVFAAAPLTRSEALECIDALKCRPLLDGYRGLPPADRQALSDILVRLGELASAYPRIREIDINPLILDGGRPIAVDATIVLGESK
jgi:acetyltransferase